MSTKVTVQDIADALQLSRTTVSKVLNQSPAVSEATRTMVLEKVKQMGYRSWTPIPESPTEKQAQADLNHFALVMHSIPGGNHMGTAVIPSMDQALRQDDYTLITCAISDEEYSTLQLPPILSHPQTKAIVCLELFHPEYSRLLCSLDKPVLFIDANADFHQQGINADLLMMENRYSTCQLLTKVIHQHRLKTMGFVGDPTHCFSFRERYEGFLQTAALEQLSWEPYCIIDEDVNFRDLRWVRDQLAAMPKLPELFFCANDFLAEMLIQALVLMGKRVPEDVKVCGFDGMPAISWPLNQLTTVVTPTDLLGTYAASILLRKLSHPNACTSVTYLSTKPLYRQSTK